MLIDRRTGVRRTVSTAADTAARYGVLSPGDSRAAIHAVGRRGHISLYLLDLATGSRRQAGITVEQSATNGTVAWSP